MTATDDTQLPVGLSTGAINFTHPEIGVQLAADLQLAAIELSALGGNELDSALQALPAVRRQFTHVTLHAPVKRRTQADSQLVTQLVAAADVDVVAHPDTFDNVGVWQQLGSRLLLENTDGRKTTGQTPADLLRLLEQLPQAGICLDISHALHAGGPELVRQLTRTLAAHIRLVHVGCTSGTTPADRQQLTDDEAALCRWVHQQLPRQVPTIVERNLTSTSDPAAAATALLQQLTGTPN